MSCELAQFLNISQDRAAAALRRSGGNRQVAIECIFADAACTSVTTTRAAQVAETHTALHLSEVSSMGSCLTSISSISVHESRAAAAADTHIFGQKRRRVSAQAAQVPAQFCLKDNSADPAHPNPPHFKQYALREEQRRSLHFMVTRERSGRPWETTRKKVKIGACGGVLGDRMGYGKTATTIALVAAEQQRRVPLNPEPDQYVSSRATLILIPSHLLRQWVDEFKKFLGSDLGGLQLVQVSHVAALKELTFRRLMSADIVLATYKVSMQDDKYKRRVGLLAGIVDPQTTRFIPIAPDDHRFPDKLKDGRINYSTADKLEALRCCQLSKSRGRHLLDEKFPVLEAFYWRRLVMDEFHESELWGVAQRDNIKFIRSHYRWGLSGTPPVGDTDSIRKVAALLGAELGVNEEQSFLDHYVRQNTPKDIVPLVERCIEVHLTAPEQLLYRQECWDVRLLTPESEQDVMDVPQEFRERLLQKCTHFCFADGVSSACGAFNHIRAQKEEEVCRLEAQLCMDSARLQLLETIDIGDEPNGVRRALDSKTQPSVELRQSIHKALETAHGGWLAAKVLPKPCSDSVILEQPVPSTAYVQPDHTRRLLVNKLLLLHQRSKLGRPLGGPYAEAAAVQEKALAKLLEMLDDAQGSLAFFSSQLRALEGEGAERSCSICMAEDVPLTELSITVCAHVFHLSCLRDWLNVQKCCPLCRRAPLTLRDVSILPSELAREQPHPGEDDWTCCPLQQRYGTKIQKMVATFQQVRREDPGAKVLVFSQWDCLLDKVAEALRAYGIRSLQLKSRHEADVLEEFQQDRTPAAVPILLLSLQNAASGANLTAANHVFLVSPMCTENLATAISYEKQAIARVRRCGQEKERVYVWRFISMGTIEEHITRRHQREAQMC